MHGRGCRRWASNSHGFFAEAPQPHVTMLVWEMHLRPLWVSEACDTDAVAPAADQRVLINLAQLRRKQVPPGFPHQVGFVVLQGVVQHTPLCLRIQWQPDQPVYLGTCAVSATGHAAM